MDAQCDLFLLFKGNCDFDSSLSAIFLHGSIENEVSLKGAEGIKLCA